MTLMPSTPARCHSSSLSAIDSGDPHEAAPHLGGDLREVPDRRLPVGVGLAQPLHVREAALVLDILQRQVGVQRGADRLVEAEVDVGEEAVGRDVLVDLLLVAPCLLLGAADDEGDALEELDVFGAPTVRDREGLRRRDVLGGDLGGRGEDELGLGV